MGKSSNTRKIDKIWRFIDDTLTKPDHLKIAASAGFPKKQFDDALKLYNNVMANRQVSDGALTSRVAATKAFNATQDELRIKYGALIEIGERIFEDDLEVVKRLGLNNEQEPTYVEFKYQAYMFYSNAMDDKKILAAYAKKGISKEDFDSDVKLYEEMVSLKRTQEHAEAERSESYQVWKQGNEELETWYNYTEGIIEAWKKRQTLKA